MDCIGVYKVPIDDEVLPYIDSEEKLALYAPGVRWVPPVVRPKTLQEAKDEILTLRERFSGLKEMVLKAELSEAGTELLDIIPRLTVSARVLLEAMEAAKAKTENEAIYNTLKARRFEATYTDLFIKLNECDITIGQALGGDLGALTPAQIQVLAEIREANSLFDGFLAYLPLV